MNSLSRSIMIFNLNWDSYRVFADYFINSGVFQGSIGGLLLINNLIFILENTGDMEWKMTKFKIIICEYNKMKKIILACRHRMKKKY